MRRLASDTLIYGLGSVANQAVAFLLLPLYTRYLTPGDYGTLALVGAAGNVLSLIAAVGIYSGMTRIYFAYADAPRRDAVIDTAVAFGVLCSALVAGTLLLASDALASLLLDDPQGPRFVRLAIGIYTLGAVNAISLSILQVHQRPRAYISCSLAGLVASMGFTIWLVAVAGRGVSGVLEGQLAGMAVQLGSSLALSLARLRFRVAGGPLREMLAFCLPLVPTNLAGWVLGVADRYVLKDYGSFADVGLYALGYRFGSVFETLFMRPFQLAWSPYLFSILDDPSHGRTCARILELYVVVAGIMILGLGLFGDDANRLMAAPAFWDAGKVIYWIGLGFLLRGSTFITVAGIHAEKKTHFSSYAYGAGVVANLLLLWWLVPPFGMMGAAFAVVLTYACVSGILWAIAQRIHPMPYRPGVVLGLIALATALYGVGTVAATGALWWRLTAKALCVGAFPAILLATGFFRADELARVRALLSRRSGTLPTP